MDYIVQQGQTLLDIIVEQYGNLEGLADVLALNPSISQNTIVQPGDVLVLNPPVNATRTEFGRKVYNVATKAVQAADIVRPDISVVPITTPGSGSPVRIVDAAPIGDHLGPVSYSTDVLHGDPLDVVDSFSGDIWDTYHQTVQDRWDGPSPPTFILQTTATDGEVTISQSLRFAATLPPLRASWDQNGPSAEFWINADGYSTPVFCYIDWGDGNVGLVQITPSPTRQLIPYDYGDGLDFHQVKVYATEMLTELSFPATIVPGVSGDLFLGGVKTRGAFVMDLPQIRSIQMVQEFTASSQIELNDGMSSADTPLLHASIHCYNPDGLSGMLGFFISSWNLKTISCSFDRRFHIDIRSRYLDRISISPDSDLNESLIEISGIYSRSNVNLILKQLYEIVANNHNYSYGLEINMSMCPAPDSTSGNTDGLAYVALLSDLNVVVTTA